MVKKHGNQVMVSVYLRPEQLEQLKALHAATRVPVAEYVREAIDDLLVKYAKDLRRGAPKR